MLVVGTFRLGIHFNTEGWQNTELSITTRLSDLGSHETRKHTHTYYFEVSPLHLMFGSSINETTSQYLLKDFKS